MRHEDDPRLAFWFNLTQEERDKLDASARRSLLELSGYPYWSLELCAELAAWVELEAEVLNAYTDWLEACEARAHRAGRRWDRAELLRQERLREVGD
ncbi:hypothetical protein C5O27_17155 [Gordonia alkanivorans]|uniref:hypothetical protein n=1 Tax=Gordonia alkanivorans TaxID=84096 RepID=UPI000FDD1527|nr:hypothetical protein [Gordonia alkanivorans]AZZ82568.1 hypothetical protein C5O27_17155 [Gordonia alkanivorans]